VIPGNIIFRQRGTHWFPGENCGMGRDHTIYATQTGYVQYYKDPEKHPKRGYIGVVFERHQTLPLPRNSPRRRRLGMVATKVELPPVEELVLDDEVLENDAEEVVVPKKERRGEEGRNLKLGTGYMYRESNWEIGRAADRAGVRHTFKPRDRWTAWKRRTITRKRKAETKRLRSRR
jgi:large subunit ribosomal protein L27